VFPFFFSALDFAHRAFVAFEILALALAAADIFLLFLPIRLPPLATSRPRAFIAPRTASNCFRALSACFFSFASACVNARQDVHESSGRLIYHGRTCWGGSKVALPWEHTTICVASPALKPSRLGSPDAPLGYLPCSISGIRLLVNWTLRIILFEKALLKLKGNTMNRQKAFSLVQLLIEVVITLFIAGIVVPSLLRSDLATKGAFLAAGSLRTIKIAGIAFSYTHPNVAFAILGAFVGAMAAFAIDFLASTPKNTTSTRTTTLRAA